MTRKNSLLTLWLVIPFLVLTGLYLMIANSGDKRHEQAALHPQVGAGANSTGGVNAVGELLAGNKANAGVRDAAPQEAAAPEAQQAAPTGMVHPETLDSGVMLIVKDRSGRANPSSPIYLAGALNGWNPKDENFKLTPQSDMRWRILIPKQQGPIEFKFTRGSWKLEELRSDMSSPGNRFLEKVDASKLKPGEPPQVELEVPHWGDERPETNASATNPYRSITVSAGSLRRLQVYGGAAGASGLSRELLVWLPPGYESPANSERSYPVLYLQDGNNLFEKIAAGDWMADETAAAAIEAGEVRPFIIVGIPNSGASRLEEYMPPVAAGAEGLPKAFHDKKIAGDAYVAWMLREVMPRVERVFRVASGPENTAIGGSSLGGLISLYAGAQHPEVFGAVLAESPTLTLGGNEFWKSMFAKVENWPRRVYIGMGGAEEGPAAEKASDNARHVGAARALAAALEAKGLGADRKLLMIEADAGHNEDAWGKRFRGAIRFVLPPEVDNSK